MELSTVRQTVKPTDKEIEAIRIVDAMLLDIRTKAEDEELLWQAENLGNRLSCFVLKFLTTELK